MAAWAGSKGGRRPHWTVMNKVDVEDEVRDAWG